MDQYMLTLAQKYAKHAVRAMVARKEEPRSTNNRG